MRPITQRPKIRILHLISGFQLGGAEMVAFRLAQAAPQGFEVAIAGLFPITSQYGWQFKNTCNQYGIKTYLLGRFGRWADRLLGWMPLQNIIHDYQPDIIHSHTDIPDFNLSLCRQILGIGQTKVVRTIHNDVLWATYKSFATLTERGFDHGPYMNDQVVGISENTLTAYKNLRKELGLPIGNQLSVIPNPGYLPPDKPTTKFQDGLQHWLFAGRMTAQKGFDVLIEALLQLPFGSRNKFMVHFFGDGDQRHLLEKLKDSKIPYELGAPQFNLASTFGKYDLLLMPSRFEGVPLAAQEALVQGVPVLAGPAKGLQLQLPPDWPLIVPEPLSAFSLSEQMLMVLNGTHNLEELGKDGQAFHSQTRIKAQQSIEAYYQLYQAIV